jgi:signal transduction histidine kinase
MMTIKNKIVFGFGVLFLLILFLGVAGIGFINHLAQKSKGTIVDNYHSIDYTVSMLNNMDKIYRLEEKKLLIGEIDSLENRSLIEAKSNFETELGKETQNITEENEDNLVILLQEKYRNYLSGYIATIDSKLSVGEKSDRHEKLYIDVKNAILQIYEVNMKAIIDKNESLVSTAKLLTIYKIITVLFSIVVALFLIFYLPKKIIRPLKELTEKIQLINEGKYHQRLDSATKDETGTLAKTFNNMAEKLEAYEAQHYDEIIFEKRRMESLVESLEDAVLLIDENRFIVLINKTVLKITGLVQDEILNKKIEDVAKKNDLIKTIEKIIPQSKKDRESDAKPLRIVLGEEEFFYRIEFEEILTYSAFLKKDMFIGTMVLLKDVTQFQKRDTAKTNLLATVSHELKTPLSSINLSLKMLDDKRVGDLNDEQKELVVSLRSQSNRLSRVIKDLLEFSQIETGNIKLNIGLIDPTDILELSVTALMMSISEKKLELITDLDESLPKVFGDIEKSVFVYVNLLNNAIRYSPIGGTISLSIKRDQGFVRFFVKDSGPGIPSEDQDKLFKRFTQINPKEKSGWGLGLAIAKEFVLAQRGEIFVESELGKGSIFCFSLPLAK